MIEIPAVRRFLLPCLLFLSFAISVCADDLGITKARLIQESQQSYVLEADVTQLLVWAIKAPVFPDRFQVSELEYVAQSGWIVVRAKATTSGEPLSDADEILLPWSRNGADLSVQWLDGSLNKGLFLRSLEGIYIPLRLLMPSERSLSEVCWEHFVFGLRHLSFNWIHLVFVAVLTLFPAPLKSLLFFAFGQGLSLVLYELGFPGFDLIFSDILGLILVLLLAYSVRRELSVDRCLPILFLFGSVHGLAYAQELSILELSLDQRLPALCMFNVGVDAGHFVSALVLILLIRFLSRVSRSRQVAAIIMGGLAVASLTMLFQEYVAVGSTNILGFGGKETSTQSSLQMFASAQSGGQRPRGARRLTSPVMSYLSVEPFEVRHEVLMQARAAVQLLGMEKRGEGSIPPESLEPVKQGILNIFQKANSISIDGQETEPVLVRADFVTLGPAGVMLRGEAIEESLDDGIIGLTLIYETPELAGEVSILWRLFSEFVKHVESTTLDPFGGAVTILSPDSNELNWKLRLSGYRVPLVEKVPVARRRIPVVSLILFAIGLFLMGLSIHRGEMRARRTLLLSIVGVGLLLYPFLRLTIALPLLNQWKPSEERTSIILDGLLTNVYRSFDVRGEDNVYDRLALSVTGDQLTEIYLESRRSLEFEHRGGARAIVYEVEVLSVNDLVRSKSDGFVADTTWTVAASINHFGHTHYRRNRYHALVTFAAVEDTWKIRHIELLEEKRLL